MWLSRQQKRTGEEPAADTGAITLADRTVAVRLDSERRGLAVYGPGGYRWRPALGEKALVLKTGDGLCVAGTLVEYDPEERELAEGEVCLASKGGAEVLLTEDGRVLVGPDAEVSGTLTVAGEELEAMIRRIVAEMT